MRRAVVLGIFALAISLPGLAYAEEWAQGTLSLTWDVRPPDRVDWGVPFDVSSSACYDPNLPEGTEWFWMNASFTFEWSLPPEASYNWTSSYNHTTATVSFCEHDDPCGEKNIAVTVDFGGQIHIDDGNEGNTLHVVEAPVAVELHIQVLPVVKLALGGSREMTQEATFMVYVPSKWGGKLTVQTTAGTLEGLSYPDSAPYTNGTETGENRFGWYTFRVTGAGNFVVRSTFVEEGALQNRPWAAWWWPWDQNGPGPHVWEDPTTYEPKEQAALAKLDMIAPMTATFDYTTARNRCACDGGCSRGYCDGVAQAAFYVPEPAGIGHFQGVGFNELDRKAIAAVRYKIRIGFPDVDEPGHRHQLFKRCYNNLWENPHWFQNKLRTRIRDLAAQQGPAGLLVNIQYWGRGVYKYRTAFMAKGAVGEDAMCISIKCTLTFRDQHDKGVFRDVDHDTEYKVRYNAAGECAGSWGDEDSRWPQTGDDPETDPKRPKVVWFSKPGGAINNDEMNKPDARQKADQILAP